MAFFLLAADLPNHVSNLDRVMTTVVPKLSKTDSVPFKALKPSSAEENSSASFARALKEADSSSASVRQASEAADNSVRLRSQNGESETSAGASEIGDDLTPLSNGIGSSAGTGSVKSGDPESEARNSIDLTQSLAVDSANVAGVAGVAVLLVNPSGIATAPDANGSTDGALTTEAATDLASSATAKAVELAQAAALWANGGPRDGFRATSTNLGLSSSSMDLAGELSGPAAPSANTAASAKLSAPASAVVLSTSQGSTISGVMDPALFAAPGGGVGAATSFDNSMGGATVAVGASGAAGAVQGAVQGTATNALLNAGRSEADVSGVGTTGSRAASFNNTSGAVSVASALAAASVVRTSGAVSVASALAAASVVRSAQSSALSDSVGLSTTAGSITGTLSVPMMSDSGGADLGGSALGTQTGGAGSESGASSGGSRSGNSNAFTVQLANPAEPNGVAASAGAVDFSARSSRFVGLGTYATTTTNTNAESVAEVSANQSPALDVNDSVTGAAVASDPRAAWRDLRSKWDQPIRANAPKG
jgi:hypothetical protein